MPPAAPPSRRDLLLALLVSVLVAVVFTWPAVMHPTQIVGGPMGEADNHLWMFWKTVAEWRSGGPLTNLPDGVPIPLMDPVNLPWYLLGSVVSPPTGLLVITLANLILLGLTTWRLARDLVGDGAAWIALVAAEASPFLAGVVDYGLTEALPLYLLVLHLFFLNRFVRAEKPRGLLWRDAILSGLCLAGFALSGWYNAFFGGVIEFCLLPWILARKRNWLRWLVQSALAVLLVLPSFVRFWGMRALWDERWNISLALPSGPDEFWRRFRIPGADLLVFFLPTIHPWSSSKTTYLGLLLVFLVVVGVIRRWRSIRHLVLPTFALLALTLGFWVRVAGHTLYVGHVPIAGPAYVLTRMFPPLGGITHWWRSLGPAIPLLAILGAAGADGLLGRRAWLLAPILLLEATLLGNTCFPRDLHAASPPAIYAMLDGDGAVMELPFENPPLLSPSIYGRRSNRWQPIHGHGVTENYDGSDALLHTNNLAAAVQNACLPNPAGTSNGQSRKTEEVPLPPGGTDFSDPVVRGTTLQGLREAGVTWVLLDREACPGVGGAVEDLESVLGPPALNDGTSTAWRVPAES